MATMADRAVAAMLASDDLFRTWSRADLREVAGISIRAAYSLYEQVSDRPEVEQSLHGGLKIREDIARKLHEERLGDAGCGLAVIEPWNAEASK